MRKLMWFAIGFAVACVIGIYFVADAYLLLLACSALIGLICVSFIHSRNGKRARLAVAGCLTGFIWLWLFNAFYLQTARACDGQSLELEIAVSDYGFAADTYSGAEGDIRLEGKPYKLRFYLDRVESLKPGDTVSGRFYLQYTYRGASRPSSYYPGEGVFLVAYASDEVDVRQAQTVPNQYFAAKLYRATQNLIDRIFQQDTAGFAKALLLGDSSGLDYGDDAALQTSGIRHIIAVSGLHVSILFSAVYAACGKKRFLTALIGYPTLLLFASVAGFSPSIVRACVMQGLMILALLLDREYDAPTALAFASLTMLAVNPIIITSVSFQLSVGCMIGIFLFSDRIENYIKSKIPAKPRTAKMRFVNWFAGSVSVTVSAMAVTMPLCAWHFQTLSVISVVANLLTLWIVSWILYGVIASCTLGAIWLPAGKALAWLVGWAVRYVLLAARVLSSIPTAAVYTENVYVTVWIVFCYVLLFVYIKARKKQPAMLACCMALGLMAAVACNYLELRLDTFRVTVLDVGQGQCILLQTKRENYIVDCGGDSGKRAAGSACRALRGQGITHVDGLILTHYDTDHVGGAEYLLAQMPVERLYLPDSPDPSGLKQSLMESAGENTCLVTDRITLELSDGKLDIIPSANQTSDNESSLCVLLNMQNCDILITGDRSIAGESELLESAEIPDLEILIVGHHGSKNSTGLELLKNTRPEVAIISVGRDNSYGHPSQDTLDRLAMFGCSVWRTDEDHTVIFRGR